MLSSNGNGVEDTTNSSNSINESIADLETRHEVALHEEQEAVDINDEEDNDDDRRLLILYASQTGSAQDIAEYIGRDAWRRHFKARVQDVHEFDKVGWFSCFIRVLVRLELQQALWNVIDTRCFLGWSTRLNSYYNNNLYNRPRSFPKFHPPTMELSYQIRSTSRSTTRFQLCPIRIGRFYIP